MDNHENHVNFGNPWENLKKHKKNRNQIESHENHKNHRNPWENHENQ